MSIDRRAYSDPSTFDEELARLFSERMFAGTKYDFTEPDSYRSVQIGDKAVTIRRTTDGIRAFNNVCLHRNNLIDPIGGGNRPFRCRYHGWSYAADGSLATAPLADEACIVSRNLPVFPVSESNGIFFLGHAGNPPKTTEVSDFMAQLQITLDEPFHRATLDHAANWKLLVENVLEGYHLSFVHADSFRPAGYVSTGDYTWGGAEYTSWNQLVPPAAHNKSANFSRLSPAAGHFYRHAYVFPDMFLSNTNGFMGFLGHLVPTGVRTTRLEWMLFELPALKALPLAAREHLKKEAIQFTTTALREDLALIESCQLGLLADGGPDQLQPLEARVAHFHQTYANWMQHV